MQSGTVLSGLCPRRKHRSLLLGYSQSTITRILPGCAGNLAGEVRVLDHHPCQRLTTCVDKDSLSIRIESLWQSFLFGYPTVNAAGMRVHQFNLAKVGRNMLWWLALAALGALFWDGPWLLVAMALQWLLKMGILVWSTWTFVIELVCLLWLEWLLQGWLPSPPAQRSRGRLLEESWILIWLSLLLSPILGFIVWQGMVGFDAAYRMHGLSQDIRKVLTVRVVKMLLVLALAVLIAWTGPWT